MLSNGTAQKRHKQEVVTQNQSYSSSWLCCTFNLKVNQRLFFISNVWSHYYLVRMRAARVE